MSEVKYVGIIQARMSSRRLPGKSLRILGETPLLNWVVRRSLMSQRVSNWVVATSIDSTSDDILEFCDRLGVQVFRGSEDDVLSRFVDCIRLFEPTHVVRVCADNPFVWGPLIDDLIEQVRESDVYLANHRTHRFCCIADGFGAEVIRAERLLDADLKSPSDFIREHVTPEISENHSMRVIRVPAQLRHQGMRFDVNTLEDLQELENLVKFNGFTINSTPEEIVMKSLSARLQELLADLYPLNRSLAGVENRQTLETLGKIIPLRRMKKKSGEKVFDWTVPQEWYVSGGFIKGKNGRKLIDFAENHLHVVSYSAPVNKVVDLSELRKHLHVHPSLEAIPYRTSYYHRDWSFSISPSQLKEIESDGGPFSVLIDSSFSDGHLDFADFCIPGKLTNEILISTYFCHPSLANDSLSGVVLSTFLARYLSEQKNLRYTYRFAFVPETIGALAYLESLDIDVNKIFCGLQITTVGGPGSFQLKQSWDQHHPINGLALRVLQNAGVKLQIVPFDIHGSDERQYSSPGFRINMITIAKDIYYSYKEYHSSLDNLDFVNGLQIAETFALYVDLIQELEDRRVFVRCEPRGEPMLSKHNLYDVIGGSLLPNSKFTKLDLALWVLFLCDGNVSICDIATRLEVGESDVLEMCEMLQQAGMLYEL